MQIRQSNLIEKDKSFEILYSFTCQFQWPRPLSEVSFSYINKTAISVLVVRLYNFL